MFCVWRKPKITEMNIIIYVKEITKMKVHVVKVLCVMAHCYVILQIDVYIGITL